MSPSESRSVAEKSGSASKSASTKGAGARKGASAAKARMPTTLDEVNWSEFDFMDIGCSEGGSVEYCVRRFGAKRGLGLDKNERKIKQARERGVDAVNADVGTLTISKQVRFVSMMDFLEHLPNLGSVEKVIRAGARAATDFLYIYHPSFEGEEYLSKLGLRQYWWNWRGHACHPVVADYCSILEHLRLNQYFIRYLGPVESSEHKSILPDSAPIDQHDYDEKKHGPKPKVDFPRPLWRAQEIFVALKPLPADQWAKVIAPRPMRPD